MSKRSVLLGLGLLVLTVGVAGLAGCSCFGLGAISRTPAIRVIMAARPGNIAIQNSQRIACISFGVAVCVL